MEPRTIQLTPHAKGLRFPYAAYRVERTTELRNGKIRHKIVYGLTSLGPDQTDEARMLGSSTR